MSGTSVPTATENSLPPPIKVAKNFARQRATSSDVAWPAFGAITLDSQSGMQFNARDDSGHHGVGRPDD